MNANAVICSVSKNTMDLAVAAANTMRYGDDKADRSEEFAAEVELDGEDDVRSAAEATG